MRISIALEKQARINVNLREGLDVETFGQLALILTDKAVKQSNDYKNNNSGEAISKLSRESHPDNLTHIIPNPKRDFVPDIPKLQTKNDVQVTQNRSEEKVSKGLVMVRCSECNKIAVMLLYVKDGQIEYKNKTLNCRNCQAELPITKLKPAYYKCPDCGTTATFYVMGDLKEANCKSCGSLIDLVWNDKKKKYVSINLIK